MTLRRDSLREGLVFCFVAGLLLVEGCGDDWAKRLSHGTTVPHARLRIVLSEPLANDELFRRLDETARAAGFLSRRGPLIASDEQVTEQTPSSWGWHPTDASNHADSDYSLTMGWDEVTSHPGEFFFIFRNGGTANFTAIEWLLFQKWKDEYFPAAFPNATITITHHPALFTDPEELIAISDATGIAIPDEVMQRYERWRAENR